MVENQGCFGGFMVENQGSCTPRSIILWSMKLINRFTKRQILKYLSGGDDGWLTGKQVADGFPLMLK